MLRVSKIASIEPQTHRGYKSRLVDAFATPFETYEEILPLWPSRLIHPANFAAWINLSSLKSTSPVAKCRHQRTWFRASWVGDGGVVAPWSLSAPVIPCRTV